MSGPKGPVLIDLEDRVPTQTPATAAPVPDLMDRPSGAAMQTVAAIASRSPSPLARWFWSLLVTLVGFIISLAAWDYVNALLARSPLLGLIITALLGLFVLVLAAIAIRELAALGRLRRLDKVQKAAAEALATHDLPGARIVISQLETLYKGRDDVAWGQSRMVELQGEVMDADGLLGLAETTIIAPLDARALREVEAAARQVAMVTAIVPLALADVFTALTSNLRMIRRIAEIYGGRAGTFGSWRLTRTVLTHLVATGAVAVGDDMISSIAGGGIVSKISRRFGEGVINGALTARVGVAAIEVCRPLPFQAVQRPSVTGLVKRSLTGLFNR